MSQRGHVSDRILELQGLPSDDQRIAAYGQLFTRLATHQEQLLSQEEVRTALHKIPSERNGIVQSLLWRLLVLSPDTSSHGKDLALQYLADRQERNRGDALQYLRTHDAERMPELLATYRDDLNEGVAYQLSEYLVQIV